MFVHWRGRGSKKMDSEFSQILWWKTPWQLNRQDPIASRFENTIAQRPNINEKTYSQWIWFDVDFIAFFIWRNGIIKWPTFCFSARNKRKSLTISIHSKLSLIYHMPDNVKKYTNAIRPMVRCILIKWRPEANKPASIQN